MDALAHAELLFTAACVCESGTLPNFCHSQGLLSAILKESASIVRISRHHLDFLESVYPSDDTVSLHGSRIEMLDTNLVRIQHGR
jgi:hypothetical protein